MFLQITKAGIWILYIKYSFRQKTKLGSLEMFPVLTSSFLYLRYYILREIHMPSALSKLSQTRCEQSRYHRCGLVWLPSLTLSHTQYNALLCLDILKFEHEALLSLCTEPHKLCSWLWVSWCMPHVRGMMSGGHFIVFFPVGLYMDRAAKSVGRREAENLLTLLSWLQLVGFCSV